MALADNWNNFIRLHGGEPGARDMFEKAMAALLRAENPGKEVHIVEASRGDGGIDVYVHHEEGIDIYQCKFYMGAMTSARWSDVRKSFDRAMEPKGVNVLRWYLCLPREVRVNDAANDLDMWHKFKEDRKSYNIVIGLIDGDEIIERMRQSDRSKGTDFIDQYFTVSTSTRHALHGIPKLLTTYVPPGPEIDLVGRDDVLVEMRKMLDSEACASLVSGLGGIGKTAVMQQICDSILNDSNDDNYAAWIICGDSLMDDLLILREPLGVLQDLGRNEAFEAVIRELQNFPGTLYLFMDNMDRIPTNEELGRMRALGPRVRVMITSRHEIEGIPHLPLEVLEKEHVIRLFYDYYKWDKEREYKDVAWDIINSDYVRSHTLLVELVAKAANASFETLPEFRCKLDEKGFFKVTPRKFSTRRFDDNLTIEEAVMKLYNISILSPEQRRIMSLFSIFTPEKEIYGAVEDWADLDVNVVDELVRLGWLVRAESGFIIHQIVRDALAMQVGDSLKIEEYGELLARIIDTNEYMPKGLEYMKARERLVLAEDIAKNLEMRSKLVEGKVISSNDKKILVEHASLSNNLGDKCFYLGLYGKALKHYKNALAINIQVLGTEHENTIATYNNLGSLYLDQGDYENAQKCYETALTLSNQVLGKRNRLTPVALNGMGGVYFAQGYYNKAQQFFYNAMEIREQELGKNHADTAVTYNNLGSVYFAQGDYKKAQYFLKKALKIRENVLGKDHPDTAVTYNNLGSVFLAQKDYKEAQDNYNKALAIRERALGKKHPSTAESYDNLGRVFRIKKDFERAHYYYEKARWIRERMLGEEHQATAVTYNNIGGVFKAQGEYKKALEFYYKALRIFEHIFGSEHPWTAVTNNNIGGVLMAQGDYTRSLEYYYKALPVFKQKYGDSHHYTKNTYSAIVHIEKMVEYNS